MQGNKTFYRHSLDLDGHITLQCEFGEGVADVRLSVTSGTNPALLHALVAQLSLATDGKKFPLPEIEDDVAHWHVAAAAHPKLLDVKVNGDPFCELDLTASHPAFKQLTPPILPTECRQLGTLFGFKLHKRSPEMMQAEGIITTDYHTHQSGQLPGRDLVRMAAEKGIGYPLRLLVGRDVPDADKDSPKKIKKAAEEGIGLTIEDLPPDCWRVAPRIVFHATKKADADLGEQEIVVPVDKMSPSVQARLAAAMDVQWDRQSNLRKMELDHYRRRYPLAKQDDLIEPTFMKIAKNYRDEGIFDAELNVNQMERPEVLRAFHKAIPEIERTVGKKDPVTAEMLPGTGVHLRALVGFPRMSSPAQLDTLVEYAKLLMESPYIAGIDVVGYENNKTEEIMPALEKLAAYANKIGDKEFTLRVHAGENDKNIKNVRAVLELAEKYKVRVRVGHALYGLDEESLRIAKRLAKEKGGLIHVELNPASNIALNNADTLDQLPVRRLIESGIPYLLGSDGSGLYGTSAKELTYMARFMGLSSQEIERAKQYQQELQDRQRKYSDAKLEAVQAKYPGGMSEFTNHLIAACKSVKPPAAETVKPVVEMPQKAMVLEEGQWPFPHGSLQPIFLVGASGTSWDRISKPQQREASVAIDMLVHALDPQKVCFGHGRAKDSGLVEKLSTSLKGLRKEQPESAHFQVISLLTPDMFHRAIHPEEEASQQSDSAGEILEKPVAKRLARLKRKTVTYAKLPGLARHVNYVMKIGMEKYQVAHSIATTANENNGIIIGIGGSHYTRDTINEAQMAGVPMILMEKPEGAAAEKAKWVSPDMRAADPKHVLEQLFYQAPELFVHEFSLDLLDGLYAASMKRVKDVERYSKGPNRKEQHVDHASQD